MSTPTVNTRNKSHMCAVASRLFTQTVASVPVCACDCPCYWPPHATFFFFFFKFPGRTTAHKSSAARKRAAIITTRTSPSSCSWQPRPSQVRSYSRAPAAASSGGGGGGFSNDDDDEPPSGTMPAENAGIPPRSLRPAEPTTASDPWQRTRR